MKIIDTHCHYNLDPFFADWQTHWQKAQQAGVEQAVIIGTDEQSIQRAFQITQNTPHLFAAVGIHPTEFNDGQLDRLDFLKKLLKTADLKNVVALGETGLDYFYLAQASNPLQATSAQKAAFQLHIELAQTLDLPLIIHVRDQQEQAYWDVLELLTQAKYQGTFILHCVSGPLAYIDQAIQQGAYLGIAGNITYKSAEHLREIIKRVPTDRLLSETDAPFLPPVPFRGQTCEPWMIKQTVEFVTSLLDLPSEVFYQNAQKVLGLGGLASTS